ncbi:hypothetical protein YQE_09425, partial [Dendroctonus ponderosae]
MFEMLNVHFQALVNSVSKPLLTLDNICGGSTLRADRMGLYKQYFKLTQHALGIKRTENTKNGIALQMLISQPISHGHLSIIIIGLFTLAMGIILSSIPWLDYIILKNLRLKEGSISFQYWQKPGVIRLTRVYIFNVTNPDGFLKQGEKPKLKEVGPFVY